MKCPLLCIDSLRVSDVMEIAKFDCLKEECAWWDTADEQCLFQTIPDKLNRIGSALQLLEQKMPHEEQF